MTGLTSQVAALLERNLGLSLGSVGTRAIESAIQRRLAAVGSPSPDSYLAKLTTDTLELEDLIGAVVVPETWFFRYPESFRHLATWVQERKAKVAIGRPVRILSIPCSTGEEPYSIAMTLLEAGLAPTSFRIVAVDVCRKSIESARNGVYSPFAFRDENADYRKKYFEHMGDGFRIVEQIRQMILFQTGNLIDPFFLSGELQFDVIFCRNLFIYLTPEARQRAINTIDRLLAPGGIVFMGHAEPLGLMDGRYKTIGHTQAFVFARSDVNTQTLVGTELISSRETSTTPILTLDNWSSGVHLLDRKHSPQSPVESPFQDPTPFPSARSDVAVGTKKTDTTPVSESPANAGAKKSGPVPLLLQARAAADRGDALETASLCEQMLRESGPHAEAFALLGVAHEMSGDRTGAEQAFTRALYLDPGHYDALVHMMVLAENRGDRTSAANYRRRADVAARKEEQS